MENIDQIILYNFIGTYLTRTGAILLIVFGIRVLITFYKYNIRMAAFNESLSVAIRMVGAGDIAKLEKLSAILSSEKITFEKTPDFGSKEVIEILKTALQTKNTHNKL